MLNVAVLRQFINTEDFGSTGYNGYFGNPQIEILLLKSPKLRISGNNGQNDHPQLIRYFRKPLYFAKTGQLSGIVV